VDYIHTDDIAVLSSTLFFYHQTTTLEIYTLSLHDALPISVVTAPFSMCSRARRRSSATSVRKGDFGAGVASVASGGVAIFVVMRSEEHTSKLQSLAYLVCRLLLEKKNVRVVLNLLVQLRQRQPTPLDLAVVQPEQPQLPSLTTLLPALRQDFRLLGRYHR